ncbi:MAG: 16S rRNA (cytosine(1402)-N(4))-methyltransferase RsmH [Geminicoccaceae bacterium]|nr:16S rRNA (cytosine(1402)-N(4))-methyltransferase RsmH [Geminicoccaceae bacterium]
MGHEPVLLAPMLAALSPRPGETLVDATFGGGGYARAILAAADCRVIGIDRDPAAVARGRELARENPRFRMVPGRFGDMPSALRSIGVDRVDGIVLDLGVSSFQLDAAERGFSFRHDGPIDMRMSSEGPSAADLLMRCDEAELATLFRRLGEEPEAGRVAKAIVERRATKRFARTADLAAVVASAKRRHKPGRDPATLVFQALRMAVNDELGELERALEASVDLLRPEGRLVVVAFHSAEDRMVKRFVDRQSGRDRAVSRHRPPREQVAPRMVWSVRKTVTASAEEVQRNPRSRSARLRAAVRTDAGIGVDENADDGWRAAA